MFGVRCSMLVVCWLWFEVSWPLFVVCCVLCVVCACRPLFVAFACCFVLLVDRCLLSFCVVC